MGVLSKLRRDKSVEIIRRTYEIYDKDEDISKMYMFEFLHTNNGTKIYLVRDNTKICIKNAQDNKMNDYFFEIFDTGYFDIFIRGMKSLANDEIIEIRTEPEILADDAEYIFSMKLIKKYFHE